MSVSKLSQTVGLVTDDSQHLAEKGELFAQNIVRNDDELDCIESKMNIRVASHHFDLLLLDLTSQQS